MKLTIQKPNIEGKTPEEAIAALDTWAANLTHDLEYILSHIDEDNMQMKIITEEAVDKKIKKSYEDIRKYIVQEVNNGE